MVRPSIPVPYELRSRDAYHAPPYPRDLTGASLRGPLCPASALATRASRPPCRIHRALPADGLSSGPLWVHVASGSSAAYERKAKAASASASVGMACPPCRHGGPTCADAVPVLDASEVSPGRRARHPSD